LLELKLSFAKDLMLVQKNPVRKDMINITTNVTVPTAAGNDALPELKNPDALDWVKTIPGLGKNSPEYAILHVDPHTRLTTLMFRTPVAVHIKAHTHDLAETHVVLIGGTHVFKSNGVFYNIEQGGFFRMPGGVVHEAWLPAGSQTLNILESGWPVNWLHGGPSEEDMDQFPPTTAR
jgi:hypothetical protein